MIAALLAATLTLIGSQTSLAQQAATTVQLPTFGVAVDAQGVLKVKRVEDPTGRLRDQRAQAALRALAADVAKPSPLRMVSLPRLERAVAAKLAAGEPLDESMLYLAGLQRLQYVFLFPDTGDIVLAGPAEGWMPDALGRVIGITSGRPVLELRDLVVALRAYAPGRRDQPFVGCTIDPNAAGLTRLQGFQRSVPKVVKPNQLGQLSVAMARGMRDSLGMADIRVFGISPQTHFAEVMIEADYRMKLIGIGLEPPPVRMKSYIDLVTSGAGTLQRWWFTPNYDCVKVTPDRLAMELVGDGVQLQTEDKVIGPGGQLLATDKPNRASLVFTGAFTSKYGEISARSPVFAQLRNLIDMLVAAAYLQQEDYYGQAGFDAELLIDETRLPVRNVEVARQVQAAANSVVKRTRVVAAAGGGVSILANKALERDRQIADKDGKLAKAYRAIKLADGQWWWDAK